MPLSPGQMFAANPLPSPWVPLGLPGDRTPGLAADMCITALNNFRIGHFFSTKCRILLDLKVKKILLFQIVLLVKCTAQFQGFVVQVVVVQIHISWVYLGVKTCDFLCFVAVLRVRVYYVDFSVFFLLCHWCLRQV